MFGFLNDIFKAVPVVNREQLSPEQFMPKKPPVLTEEEKAKLFQKLQTIKSIPQGLAKKPGGMPPGQYKQLWEEATQIDMNQASQQMYLDPEGMVKATRYAQNLETIEEDFQSSQREYARNMALTAKGFHPAKVPHPLLTHFLWRK